MSTVYLDRIKIIIIINTSDTEAAFLDLHLSFSNDIVSTKIYDKHDDFCVC